MPQPDPQDDRVHPPRDHDRWRESYYFSFFDFKLGIGGFSSIGKRPGKGFSGSIHCLFGPDMPTLVASERGRVEGHTDVTEVAGLSYTAREPLGVWDLRFSGRLNDGGDGVHCDLRAVTQTEKCELPSVDVEYHLVFTPTEPAYMYEENPEWDGLFDGHVDEVGTMTGEIRIGDRVHRIDARGSKDHSWGVRDWARPKNWRWADVLFEDDGPEPALWRATFDGERWLQDGALYGDGRAEALLEYDEEITYDDRERHPAPATWTFDMGSESHRIKGTGEVVRVVPLLFPIRDDEGTPYLMWNDRTLIRCRTEDGRDGWAGVEFQSRVPDPGRGA
jgi:hypothetical protein